MVVSDHMLVAAVDVGIVFDGFGYIVFKKLFGAGFVFLFHDAFRDSRVL